MKPEIEAIYIDVGNTMRLIVEDPHYQAQAKKRIAELVGTGENPDVFCAMLDERYKVYRKKAFETLLESPERELWTQWMLPECPPEQIGPLSGELTFLYRQTMGRRFAAPDAKKVVVELHRRGYSLGIISNTITEREIPRWLEEDGLRQYFKTVVLSSLFGHRKPGTKIYDEAVRTMGIPAVKSVYVGDNPVRDVQGTRKAGFGMVIIMIDQAELEKKPIAAEDMPDRIIHSLSELLDIFPARQVAEAI